MNDREMMILTIASRVYQTYLEKWLQAGMDSKPNRIAEETMRDWAQRSLLHARILVEEADTHGH